MNFEILHSIQTEQGVLATLMTLTEGVDQFVTRMNRDYFTGRHQIIFDAMQSLQSRGEKFDMILVWDEIKKDVKNLNSITEEYFLKLSGEAPSIPSTLEQHIEKLYRLMVRRKLIDASNMMQGMARDFTTSLDDLLIKSQTLVTEIGTGQSQDNIVSVGNFVAELYGDIADAMEQRKAGTYVETGIKTGFIALDNKLGSIARGNLVIIGARPSMGKTTLAQNIMADMAINQGLVVQFNSCEMKNSEIRDRLVAGVGEIELRNIKTKNLKDDDWAKLTTAHKKLEKAKFEINDKANASLTDIREMARRMKFKYGSIDAIFVDYLQLLKSPIVTDNQPRAIGEISKGLKAIAKDFDCVVVALSQLSRSLENRPNKRPLNADLRESGQIEQDADVILFIYRDEIYNKETKEAGIAEIIIGKCRDGEIGTVRLGTDLARATFADLSPEYLNSLASGVGGV
ncbi:replicative DNA helicase [Acinetobacter sp. ANC 4640]